ncbi:RidA family protein [Thiofilum flexile]|uniref:RidA family protein n=1 Tax=Thiofilum flexile TaxID=125627 RepID=UPI000379A29A|nr:RidA family protein [Thiofilum flexile]
MQKTIIESKQAPAAIGPYSQAVKVGDLVFLSGQIPLDPETMTMIEGDIVAQAHQVFKNLAAVAKAAGGSLDNCVKVHVFLTDLGDFAKVNEVMQQYFNAPYPARAAIGVAALPRGSGVEVDAIMAL